MLDFRTVKIGDRVKFTSDEFEVHIEREGIVGKTEDDHAIVYAGGMGLWLDDTTAYQFEMIKPAGETLDFSGLDMTSMDFTQLPKDCLRNADFRNADLTWTDFTGMDLRGANFAKAEIYDADFCWCDLRGVDMFGAYIARSDFANANLLDCNISAADLYLTDLTGAKIDSADRDYIEHLACKRAITL